MHGHAVVIEQGVQERAQNAPLWSPSVEDQRGGDVVYLPSPPGGRPVRKFSTQLTLGLEHDDEFGGYYGVKC